MSESEPDLTLRYLHDLAESRRVKREREAWIDRLSVRAADRIAGRLLRRRGWFDTWPIRERRYWPPTLLQLHEGVRSFFERYQRVRSRETGLLIDYDLVRPADVGSDWLRIGTHGDLEIVARPAEGTVYVTGPSIPEHARWDWKARSVCQLVILDCALLHWFDVLGIIEEDAGA